MPGATSRTTTGTRSRPAILAAARQRRSLAMIWKVNADAADDDRLDDAVGADRLGEFLQAGIVDVAARLEGIRLEAIDVGFDAATRASALGTSGISALRPFPEGGAFLQYSQSTSSTAVNR